MKCSLGISNFLEEISSLSHSVLFFCFFALIAAEGFLISSCYSLELCIQMLVFPFLLCFLLPFFSQLFVRPPQTAILLFCISFPCRTLVTSWTVTHQAPQSMEFSRQENWSGLPFPSPGNLPDPEIKPGSPAL